MGKTPGEAARGDVCCVRRVSCCARSKVLLGRKHRKTAGRFLKNVSLGKNVGLEALA